VFLFLENRMIYHPVRAEDGWEDPPSAGFQDVEMQTPDGTRIHAWWCPPEDWTPARGALLYCHGNAGNLSHRGDGVLRWQKEMETAVLIFDYPGYGKSGGRPSEAGCYAAANMAYDWLVEKQQVPAERLLLYGGSLGGGVAVELAQRRPHRALILVSTFTSIPDMASVRFPRLPVRWLVRHRFESINGIVRCRRPVFIAHGTADRVIPFAHGQRLFTAANEPKRFFSLEGYDHNHTPPGEFYRDFREFLAGAEGGKATQ
jgi:fermentation-respiration switch protein FrsA (DUF1100 family)